MDLLAKELCATILTTVLAAHGAFFRKVGHSRRYCAAQSSFSLRFLSLKMSFRLHWCTSVRERNDIVEEKGAMKDYIWRQQLMITGCYKKVGEWKGYESWKKKETNVIYLSIYACFLLICATCSSYSGDSSELIICAVNKAYDAIMTCIRELSPWTWTGSLLSFLCAFSHCTECS